MLHLKKRLPRKKICKYEISSDEEMDEISPDVLHVMQYAAIPIQFTLREHKNSHSFGLKMHQICINENDMQGPGCMV